MAAANLLLVAVSSWLVWAGLEKLRRPEVVEAAVAELLGKAGFKRASGWGRVLGACEVALGCLVAVGAVPMVRSVIAITLAAAITVVGILGIRRGSTLRCGCFGAASTRPLGGVSIASGVAMATVAVITFTHQPGDQLLPAVSLVLIAIAVARADPLQLWRPDTGHLPPEGARP